MGYNFPEVIPQKEAHVWATLVPYRTPEFKVHSRESLANSALSQRGLSESYAKYKLIDGQWTRVFLYEPPRDCGICGEDMHDDRYRACGYKPVWTAPVVCWPCYEGSKSWNKP